MSNSSVNQFCSDSPNFLRQQCRILTKCTTFGEFNTHPTSVLKSSSNISVYSGKPVHILFLPSGLGVGQMVPIFQLASMLASHKCKITFITMKLEISTTKSSIVSSFFSGHPEIKQLDFHIFPLKTSTSKINDPFIKQIDAISNSLHQLCPLIDSLNEPVSAIVSEFIIASSLSQVSSNLNIPLYIISTTSAKFYSTVAYLPVLLSKNPTAFENVSSNVEIPGLGSVQKSSIPRSWLDDSPSNYVLKAYLLPNARALPQVTGVFMNTFDWFEPETIVALDEGRVTSSLPLVFPVGPVRNNKLGEDNQCPWLDEQPAESVVYVNFGTREPISSQQLREIRKGLEICGYKFLWVLKEEILELFGSTVLEEMEKKGKIGKAGEYEEAIIEHPAVGLFVNQCEWDSVMNAAWSGVPMLAWPQHGDQKLNAEVVEKSGLGRWVKEWGWGEENLVNGEEIAEMVKSLMGDVDMKVKAMKVRDQARKAKEIGGSSEKRLRKFIEMLKAEEK
uniref:Anthocyanidin 3-O-glucosyltransferase 2-like n=2 Tax=Nicotiana sylvestris TaxID=4096 RepID=A0A1U7XTT0_NICSY|nr:PREDICTED: anthocyanidin 3-O-glucosyltransferase 2-like [Nicotiana sylvestris]